MGKQRETAHLQEPRNARGMTRAELLALPASIPLDVSNRAIGVGRTTGYDLAKRGQYPARVLRIGNQYRVITESLLEVLGIDVPRSADGPEAA